MQKAVYTLKKYIDKPNYIALIPDTNENIDRFCIKILSDEHKYISKKNIGFINWKEIENISTNYNLYSTLENFLFNEGQIYNNGQCI